MQLYRTVTDDTLRENVQHGRPDFPFAYYVDDIWKYDFHYIDWHWHYEIEIVTASRGTVICLIGSDKVIIQPGTGVLINSGVIHRFETTDGAIMPNIVFYPTLLSPENSLIFSRYVMPFLQSGIPYQTLRPETEWQNRILLLLSAICEQQEQPEPSELQTLQLLLQLWGVLIENVNLHASVSEQKRNVQQYKLRIMLQFIHDHFSKDISLSDIAASASVSKSTALQIFKNGINISPVEYLIRYRLSQAALMLRTTEQSVSVIAQDTGFTASSYFCRKFKEYYHLRPNEYRRNGLKGREKQPIPS